MRKLLNPFGLLICMGALVIASCSKKVEPVTDDGPVINAIADFKDSVDVNDGFTFNFKNLSQNYAKFEWRFGDDSISTDANPSHTFLTTGKYTTDLKVFSKTGTFSHKYVDINIKPEDVLQLSATKTGVQFELKLDAKFKGKIKNITWVFSDVDPAKSTTNKVTYTDVSSVTRKFIYGSFNSFTVSIVSDKGSTVSLTRNITPDGIVTDITQNRIAWDCTIENTDQGPNEGKAKLIDGNPDTKFGFYKAFPKPFIFWLQWAKPETVILYAIENGNDSDSHRDPKEWVIEASDDSTTGLDGNWQVVDHQNLTIGFADYLSSIGQSATKYKRFFYYPIANPQPHPYYRWRIISLFESAFQIEELRFYR